MNRPACITEAATLAPLTSWLIGGPADFLAMPTTIEEARACVRWATENTLPISVLGGGTNVLISDKGVEGLTLCLRRLAGVTVDIADDRARIECLAGTSKSELLKICLKRNLEPALFLAGLPGDIGGGIAMNAGVAEALHPREFVELVDWIEVLRFDRDASLERIEASSLNWSYRHCNGWGKGAIVRTGLSWPSEPRDGLLERVRELNKNRLSKQPLDMPSCGSVFVNPPGEKAGRLIEACGLKGFAIGGARISAKHANFIVNEGSASAGDVAALIKRAQSEALARFAIELKTEVAFIGRADGF